MLTVVLIVAGALAFWGYSYTNNTVKSQLASQDIVFPSKAAFANAKPGTEITPAMIPYLEQYAGEKMTTGAQAEAYANHFIAIHLSEMPYHGVYSQVSAAAMAAAPGSAQATSLKSLEQTVFQGTSLRGMLLNAYGWWKMGQIALWSSIAMWTLAGVMGVLSLLGLRHFRKAPITEEIPRLATADVAAAPYAATPATVGNGKVTTGANR